MATKVYLSGSNVIVDQTGQPLLRIPQRICSYTVIQPTASNDGLTIPVAVNMYFSDIETAVKRTEAILSVQTQAGVTFADFAALQAYLVFITISSQINVAKEGASVENQLIMIDQNTEIESELEETSENTRELKKIKEELKTNNKILKKIYN
jgi:hypothetical protein